MQPMCFRQLALNYKVVINYIIIPIIFFIGINK